MDKTYIMKTHLIALFLCFLGLNLSGQIRFERAYFIDNQGNKTECLIKNSDWHDNPNSFVYRSTETARTNSASLETVQEFGVYNFSKYIRAKVDIDRSSGEISKMDYFGNAVFHSEELFLKVLIEGEVSLYQYSDGDLNLFFYQTPSQGIRQLVYKRYIVDQNTIASNVEFREQLAEAKCAQARPEVLQELKYYKSELIKYVIAYHQCKGLSFTNYDGKIKRDLFNVRVTSGLSFSDFIFVGVDGFSQKATPRLGLDLEFVLPFNKSKWAFFVEPNLQSFFATESIRSELTSINYRALEVPAGLRHYFFITEDLRFSLSAAYAFELSFNSAMNRIDGRQYELSGGNVFAGGAGMSYKKFSAELRWYEKKDLLRLYPFLESDLSKVALVLGWKLW